MKASFFNHPVSLAPYPKYHQCDQPEVTRLASNTDAGLIFMSGKSYATDAAGSKAKGDQDNLLQGRRRRNKKMKKKINGGRDRPSGITRSI